MEVDEDVGGNGVEQTVRGPVVDGLEGVARGETRHRDRRADGARRSRAEANERVRPLQQAEHRLAARLGEERSRRQQQGRRQSENG